MNSVDYQYYKVLGIDPEKVDVLSLSKKEITTAYRKAVLRSHPDKNRGDPSAKDKFLLVGEAYRALSDPQKRKEYDQLIKAEQEHKKRLAQQDIGRRRFRDQLDRDEREAVYGERRKNEKLGQMQTEMDQLRKEAALAHTRSATTDRRPEKRPRDSSNMDAGIWKTVPGFDEFRATGTSSFEDFEQQVLNGK